MDYFAPSGSRACIGSKMTRRRTLTNVFAVRWLAPLALAVVLVACGGGSGSGSGSGSSGNSPSPPPPLSDAAATRFLEQAAFGPTTADVAHVKAVGFDAWLTEQFSAPLTDLPDVADTAPLDTVQTAFFANAVNAPDQLRQRLAFALSQIYVVSNAKVDNSKAMVNYYRVLLNDAFASHRQLLKDVTLSPAMGVYLDMVDNTKADPSTGTSPNENYGRELLQLFSVGLFKLKSDGSVVVDGSAKPVGTYDQDTIEGFSRALTGWTFPTRPGQASQDFNPTYFVGPMESHETYHEPGSKVFLNGVVQPGGQSAPQDLDVALSNISQHQNTGPFLALRLIQALVKSNPSPAYIQRVSAVYADNGTGARADLKAVTKAVLLDVEARAGDTQAAGSGDGKLREPVLYMTRLLRAFKTKTNGAGLAGYAQSMRQDVLNAPSVFNFYPPSYKPRGSTLLGPEFKILNSATLLPRLQFASDLSTGTLPTGTSTDLSDVVAVATDANTLVTLLDQRLMHGTASAALKSSVAQAVNAIGTDGATRAATAVYLFAASPEFQIQR